MIFVIRAAQIEDVGRLLEPFAGQRIDEQMVVPFDDFLDALAARRRPAAEG